MTDLYPKSPGPRIKPVEVPGYPKLVDLVRGADGACRLAIGRGANNDIVLDGDGYPSVSANHARFELRGDQLWIVDLGSRNGVLLNGEPIAREARVAVGDQVRLGSVGPRFLVVSGRGLSDTVFVQREAARPLAREVVEISERRTRRLVIVLGALIVTLLGVTYWQIQRGAARRQSRTSTQLEAALAQIAALEQRAKQRDVAEATDRTDRELRIAELERQALALEATMETQSEEEARLMARIAELEGQRASREVVERVEADLARTRIDLDAARTELDATRAKVEMFDPVNLAQERLSGVASVRQSIVLIENRTRIVNRETGKSMHLLERGGVPVANFEGRGEEFTIESTGSGFCVDAAGHIVTNAHVVEMPDSGPLRSLASQKELVIVQTLEVVFSGTSKRILAQVVERGQGELDLALLRIQPFEGMPALEDFKTTTRPPEPGSDIFLFGFPLGNLAVQEGETVIASTFRGILSRNVGGQMQVDAGVHPGNSGGPITDANGDVVGIVVSVQALPDRTAVYTIGYGIPIAEATGLWPPKSKVETASTPK